MENVTSFFFRYCVLTLPIMKKSTVSEACASQGLSTCRLDATYPAPRALPFCIVQEGRSCLDLAAVMFTLFPEEVRKRRNISILLRRLFTPTHGEERSQIKYTVNLAQLRQNY